MESKNRKSRLPIIALAFAISPLVIWYFAAPMQSIFFSYLFFGSLWGLGFQAIGLVLGIVFLVRSIYRRKEGIDIRGIVISIFAISSPFIWFATIMMLYRGGMEIWL